MCAQDFEWEVLRFAQDDTLNLFMTLTKIIEALLFSAQKPLSIRGITAAIRGAEDDEFGSNEFIRVKEAEVAAALEQLKIEYIEQGRAFQLTEKAEVRWKRWRSSHIASPSRALMWKRSAA